MTPCIDLVNKKAISHTLHEYQHEAESKSYGLEAAEKMGVSEAKVFKTLVVSLDNRELVVALIPVSSELSMKLIATAANAKKAVMAEKLVVERSTGYVLGGVSPLGQKKQLRIFIDDSALDHSTIFVSAGRRGLEIELCPHDLKNLVSGLFVTLSAKS